MSMTEEKQYMVEMHYYFFLMIKSNFSFIDNAAKWTIKWK